MPKQADGPDLERYQRWRPVEHGYAEVREDSPARQRLLSKQLMAVDTTAHKGIFHSHPTFLT